ncbi:predicted protein [Micromonas commoda]|uniref:Uncharacterized protein n=1 Tax=Micromonas commoda (strain RCC299 / NOUM17 / CCMP2709) TaxID=296587 RepID=C1E6R3_MICCC|nr:predicted protein [Micromonas commoda]ACO63849.1 predicted protein [Micromonas commoda]|eukprot:XP_002502591.1 predicted protein [Micromonas commoda]
MRLIVVIACIIVAATAVVAQEDPCVAELARCRDACGNREILVNDCASASGFLSKACSCGGALDAPAGEEGAIETTSETVYFDGGAVAMLGSEDAQETKAKKPCPHHESMSMEPALMFNRRFGPGFASLFDELFDETEEAGGGWTTRGRPALLGRDASEPRGVTVSFGPGLGVFGNARQRATFNAFQPQLVFRTVFYPEPRPLPSVVTLFDLEGSADSDLGSMDPSAREESVMGALQRWRDVSEHGAAATWKVREEEEEEGGGVRAMEVNREAMSRAGRKTRRGPEDEGGATRRLVLAFASVALIAAVLTLTSAALVCVASLATRALGRMFRGRGDSGLAVDAVDVSEPLLLEYETTREVTAGALSTVYADAAPAAPTPRRASVEDETMEVMMPMPLERGERSTWRSEPGYSRL